MGILTGDSPLVGFRYEVSIVPDMGVNRDDGFGKFDVSNAIKSVASSAVSVVDKASFSEISGVTVTLESEPIRDLVGEWTESVKGVRYSPLVLKRGLTGTQSQLMAWVTASLIGEEREKSGMITKTIIVNLLNDKGSPIMCWVFNGAYPTKWSMSGLNAMSNELVIEELELKYKHFYPVVLGI